MLPEEALWLGGTGDWQRPSIGRMLAEHAEQQIPDDEYSRECTLPNGWILSDKEELMYYRVFREFFGDTEALAWVGRTRWDAEVPAQVITEPVGAETLEEE